MRVAFYSRSDLMTKIGGDTIQILNTKKFLEKDFPIEIFIIDELCNLNNSFDILHVFNIQNQSLVLNAIKRAKDCGVPVVVSTIYWDLSHSIFLEFWYKKIQISFPNYLRFFSGLFSFALKNLPFRKGYLSREYRNNMREILLSCDLLLPNSPEEAVILQQHAGLKVNSEKIHIVPNAIDINFKKNERVGGTISNVKKIALIGRIEPTKNQISLVKALYKNENFEIYFIGKDMDRESFYSRSLRKISEKSKNVNFIEEMENADIFKFLNEVDVHVLPSFRESPGLVSLEALLMGCKIVVSNKKHCPVNYYEFDKVANICDPYNINSIRDAIIESIKDNRDFVSGKYFEKFSYKKAATETFKSYKKIMA